MFCSGRSYHDNVGNTLSGLSRQPGNWRNWYQHVTQTRIKIPANASGTWRKIQVSKNIGKKTCCSLVWSVAQSPTFFINPNSCLPFKQGLFLVDFRLKAKKELKITRNGLYNCYSNSPYISRPYCSTSAGPQKDQKAETHSTSDKSWIKSLLALYVNSWTEPLLQQNRVKFLKELPETKLTVKVTEFRNVF